MGKDIHIHLVKRNRETNLYEELILYKPGEDYYYDEFGDKIINNPDFKKIPIYDERNYEMFEGMIDGDKVDGYGNFPHAPIDFNSLEPKFKKEIKDIVNTTGYFDFYETNLADMKLYLNEHPIVVDYDGEWEEGVKSQKTNPIKYLYNDICSYGRFADNLDWNFEPLSSYKIIFYFDW